MMFMNPSVQIIESSDPFTKIEIAGRTCYKSEAKITEDSARKFYQRLVKNSHTAMLEHAFFVLEVRDILCKPALHGTSYKHLNYTTNRFRILISGNLRALNECEDEYLLYALYKIDPQLVYAPIHKSIFEDLDKQYKEIGPPVRVTSLNNYSDISEEEIRNHKYTTMKFICDRGVSHEIVRHRLFSFAQESTRYVNYTKNDEGLQFITPAKYTSWSKEARDNFVNAMQSAEYYYNTLVNLYKLSPQEARSVLPNAVKTELIVTGNDKEWQHFFNLRSLGTTGAPHPDMKYVADMARKLYEER